MSKNSFKHLRFHSGFNGSCGECMTKYMACDPWKIFPCFMYFLDNIINFRL